MGVAMQLNTARLYTCWAIYTFIVTLYVVTSLRQVKVIMYITAAIDGLFIPHVFSPLKLIRRR